MNSGAKVSNGMKRMVFICIIRKSFPFHLLHEAFCPVFCDSPFYIGFQKEATDSYPFLGDMIPFDDGRKVGAGHVHQLTCLRCRIKAVIVPQVWFEPFVKMLLGVIGDAVFSLGRNLTAIGTGAQ